MIPDGELILRAARWCEALRAARRVDDGPPLAPAAADAPDPGEAFWRRARAARPVAPARVEPGQLWVAAPPAGHAGARALLLVLRIDGALAHGALASDEAWVATDEDLILDGAQSPLGLALAVLLDRPVAARREALRHFVGAVPREALALTGAVASVAPGVTGGAAGADPADGAGWIARGEVAGAGRAARQLLRRAAVLAGGARLAWLAGPPIDDDEDPRLEARALLGEATAWLEPSRWTAPAARTAASEDAAHGPRPTGAASTRGAGGARGRGGAADVDRLAARVAALAASLPGPFPGGAPAGVAYLVGALRGEDGARARRLRVEVGPAEVELRLAAQPGWLEAGAHFVARGPGGPGGLGGPGGADLVGVRLALRNAATGDAVRGDGDAAGVVLPLALPVSGEEPVELELSVGGPGAPASVRLAL